MDLGQIVNSAAGGLFHAYLYDFPYVVSLPVNLMMMLVLVIYFLWRKSERRLYFFTFFFLAVLSVWVLTVSHVIRYFYGNSPFLDLLALSLMYLLPVSADLLLYQVLEKAQRIRARRFVMLYLALMMVSLFLMAFHLPGLFISLCLFYLLLPFLQGSMLVFVHQRTGRGDRCARALELPILIFTVLGVFDFFNQVLGSDGSTFVLPLAIFTTLSFNMYLMQEQFVRERSLEEHAPELEQEASEVEKRSGIDALTQCLNRQRFREFLQMTVQQTRQSGDPLSFLIFDIDFFKRFNDTYGHAMGDVVLRQFAKVASEELPEGLMLFRWGGEEFTVICRGMDMEEAAMIGGLVRRRISGCMIFPEEQVTVSVGVSVWHGEGDSAEAMFRRADEALYQAKRSGRNLLCVERPCVIAGAEKTGEAGK
jgi:diguanylate cyclase (GGDEF)-like protein